MVELSDGLEIGFTWSDALAEELRRFLTRRLKCPDAAEDLTHETYLRLQKQDSIQPLNNARALAFHIAMNLAVDYQRKVSVRNRFVVDEDIDSCSESTSNNPEQTLIARQRLEILQKALDELPTDCRTVFLLHGVDGLKYVEIADRLGISISMVGKHLARAMAHCSQRVDT